VFTVLVARLPALAASAGRDTAPAPVIHITDVHRPYNDPDDHWDLACVYVPGRAYLLLLALCAIRA
jgi:hypothetical protein